MHAQRKILYTLVSILLGALFLPLSLSANGSPEPPAQIAPGAGIENPTVSEPQGSPQQNPQQDLQEDLQTSRGPSHVWEFVVIPFDEEQIRSTINLFVEQGYQPAALEFDGEGSLYALFVRIPLLEKTWSLIDFSPLSTVNSEFPAWLQEGWMPLDFTLSGEHFMTIFAKTGYAFSSMRVISLEITEPQTMLSDVKLLVDGQAAEGRVLYGLTADNDALQLMFIQSDATLLTPRFEFRIYPNDGESFFLGLEANVQDGGVPAGLAVTKDFLYTGYYYQ